MDRNGLTISMIFEAESANYGEGLGNVASLKKISRGNGDSYSYISRQALRYNIIGQMGVDNTPLGKDGSVIQFEAKTTITDYPEIDLFGYMKTVKPTKTRSAVARLSNAVALESFNADLDFLTNKGLLDRYNGANSSEDTKGNNIAQSEIHKSYYAYTITVDLDKVGIDTNDDIKLDNNVKCERVTLLLNTIKLLYRDIKGRRENLTPIFVIGGVYETKNPFFENRLTVKNNKLGVNTIKGTMDIIPDAEKQYTHIGLLEGIFSNDHEITTNLEGVTSVGEVFRLLCEDVADVYK
ncbi:MAG: type I-B CRISPR-associated protein Cas7/Cst2/DevR [Epulopiscium sp. Nele67-Bin004]|nr:MAG: type I-B CRISPR-associated protein Cas7/Cst2/DevR [Epulopiscium sp. Nele67-Bin004]